jgi:hypothetical protein
VLRAVDRAKKGDVLTSTPVAVNASPRSAAL